LAKAQVTLGIDAGLVARAQVPSVDLAEILQTAVGRLMSDAVAETGATLDATGESPEALADHNRRIRERGCFGDT
jgi:hypothetical protein